MPSDLNQRRLRLIWQPTIYGVQGPWLRRRCRIRKVFMCDCISYHDEYHHVLPPRHTPSMAVSENENVVESRRTEIFGHGYCVVIHRMRLPGPRPLFSPSFWHMVRFTDYPQTRLQSTLPQLEPDSPSTNTHHGQIQTPNLAEQKCIYNISRKDGSQPWSSLSHPGWP